MTRFFDSSYQVDMNGVLAFIYFLSQIADQTQTTIRKKFEQFQKNHDENMRMLISLINCKIQELQKNIK